MTKKQTQCIQILDFMQVHGSITNRQAFAMGISSLPRRIKDLKDRGHEIVTAYTNKRFAVYSFDAK